MIHVAGLVLAHFSSYMLEHILSCTLILSVTTEANRPCFQPSAKAVLRRHNAAQVKVQTWEEKRIVTVVPKISKQVVISIIFHENWLAVVQSMKTYKVLDSDPSLVSTNKSLTTYNLDRKKKIFSSSYQWKECLEFV